jgi:hypothetical protein
MNSKAQAISAYVLLFATVFILIILLIFILISSFIKNSEEAKGYVKIDRLSKDLPSSGDSVYVNQYWAIDREIQHVNMINSALNCRGEFNGENRSLYEVLGLWDSGNSEKIAEFTSINFCASSHMGFLNRKTQDYFGCSRPGDCQIMEGTQFSQIEFRGQLESCGIKFSAVPYDVDVYVSSACYIPFGGDK